MVGPFPHRSGTVSCRLASEEGVPLSETDGFLKQQFQVACSPYLAYAPMYGDWVQTDFHLAVCCRIGANLFQQPTQRGTLTDKNMIMTT